MLSTSTRKRTNKALDRRARSGVIELCKVPSSHSVNARRSCNLPQPILLFCRRAAEEKKQTRNMALVAASLGPAGMKPNGVELRCLSHFFMTPS